MWGNIYTDQFTIGKHHSKMTTFSKANFQAANYNSFRPHYPPTFYKILSKYATKKVHLSKTVDLGCGTGVATYPLLNISDKVVGVDLLAKMIETANQIKQSNAEKFGFDASRINFTVASAESLVKHPQGAGLEQGKVDLITAAQCIHWFQDFDSFFQACHKLLRPGGTLAYWYYVDPIVSDYLGSENDTPQEKLRKLTLLRQIIDKYLYDDPEFAGPHWEQPGRNILRQHLEEVNKHIPKELFGDIVIQQYHADANERPYPSELGDDLYLVQRDLPLSAISNYIATNSGYHNYRDAYGEKAIDIPKQILKEWESELQWDSTTTVDFVYQTGYVFVRAK